MKTTVRSMDTLVRSSTVWVALFSLVTFAGAFVGCNSSDDNNPAVEAGHAPGVTQSPDTPDNPTLPDPSTNPNLIRLGVKYVALKLNASDADSPTQAQVQTLVNNMSKMYAQCDIGFVLEDYSAPVASDVSVDYYPANHSQLDAMRSRFDDRARALLVKTGTWNRSGNLGNDGSNGFSTLPPAKPEGAVFESGVAASTLLISHETGHLIGGLGHSSSTTNLMNHFVTSSTTTLTQSQCDDARTAIRQYHSAWIR